MDDRDELADEFETQRVHLWKMAFRMLGSSADADDAVQETWLRLMRTDADAIENLPGWLRTTVSRISLDLLRSRRTRREDLVGVRLPDDIPSDQHNPEDDAVLVDSVGRALLVVLDRLEPVERVAFVLHDMFAVPFAEIAPVVERTSVATKKIASRARKRVHGAPTTSAQPPSEHRTLVDAFLTACRVGDIPAILAVLAPDVVRRAEPAALPAGRPAEVRGADVVAKEIAVFGQKAQYAATVLINGTIGLAVAPHGHLESAITFTFADDKIAGYELIADPDRLRRLDISVVDT